MLTTERPRRVRYRSLFAVYFFAYSGFVVFRNVYFEDLGMSGSQMGMIGFVLVIVGVIAQPVWGLVTDWRGNHKSTLYLGSIGSGLALLSYLLGGVTSSKFAIILAGTVLFSLFHAPILPIANSLVLSERFDYGRVRAFGSIAFGIGSISIGLVLSELGTSFIVIVYATGMAIIAFTLRGTRVNRPKVSADLGGDVRSLVVEREFVLLLGVALLLAMASGSSSAYFSVYMRAIGVGDSMTGLAWLIKTACEAFAFLYLLRSGLSFRAMLIAGALSIAITNFVYTNTADASVVLAVQSFGGVGYAMYYLAVVNLAHRLSPDGLASTAQTLVGAIGLGLGSAIGQVGAGWIMDSIGVQRMFLYIAFVAALAALTALRVDGGH